MTYKAYIDNIYAKTGKKPEDYQKMAREKGLVKHGEPLKWLKTEYGLGTDTRTLSSCTSRIPSSPRRS